MKYPPAIAALLGDDHLNELGPGLPNKKVYSLLKALTPENAFAGMTIQDRDMARACLSGLWLYHNFLDESHAISQEIHTPTGSYWHGIMHRREPDSSNAKYWFRKVGKHPIFQDLGQCAKNLALEENDLDHQSQFLLHQVGWEPFLFIDLCESSREKKPNRALLCKKIQAKEWQLLFDFCFANALHL